jgi:phage terminase Nu1 subunit (DNA packaging protein)
MVSRYIKERVLLGIGQGAGRASPEIRLATGQKIVFRFRFLSSKKGGETLKNKEFLVVTTLELSEILGLSDRRIQQLVKEGIISRLERGKFHLPTVIQEYTSYIQSKAMKSDEEYDLWKEKTLLIKAQREKAELELQAILKDLHHSEDVRRVMNHMLGFIRARCSSIPANVAPKIVGKDNLSVIQSLIKDEVYVALTEIANYDPQQDYTVN